ncbi:SoxR reducing system RseC family protein [Glaciecola sp. 1036]|uniref:SoxR reducing system RseC family protein n=1 Tax=Alteromonadaceae TaxID=72275 RepID=UPI003D02D256
MIEEIAVVVKSLGSKALVETQVKTTCGHCQVKDNCGTSTIAKAFSNKTQQFYVETPEPLAMGQQVKIGIPEQNLLIASMLVYLLPLLSLILVAFVGQVLLSDVHELIVVVASFFAAFLTFVWVSRLLKSAKMQGKFDPIFISQLSGKSERIEHSIFTKQIDD